MDKHFTVNRVFGAWSITDVNEQPLGLVYLRSSGDPELDGPELARLLTEAWRRGVRDGEEALRRRVDEALVSMFARAA